MGIDVAGTTLTGGTTLTATDSSGNKLFHQDSNGITKLPTNSAGATMIPLFHVGRGVTNAYSSMPTGVVAMTYTGGNGYTNIGSCYNTTNSRFTAPWTGLYLFQGSMYTYSNSSAYTLYYHPLFLVNGSTATRRPGGTPYRIRGYGMYASYVVDPDMNEIIYLTAGDYVEWYVATSGTWETYDSYAGWSGVYLGN